MAAKPGAAAPAAAPEAGASGAGGRGEPPRTYMTSKRLQQTQAQVDEVVDIMRVNVEKVLERDQKLSELDNRAEALQVGASRFEQSAGKLKNKFWWQNMKMTLILVGVVAVVVIAVVVWVMTGQKQDQPQYLPAPAPAPVAPEPAVGPAGPGGNEAGVNDDGGDEETETSQG